MQVSPETAGALITLISGLALGLIAGGGSVLVLVHSLKNDKALLTAIEALAKSAPPELISALKEISPALKDTADIIDTVTDNVAPATQPPATP